MDVIDVHLDSQALARTGNLVLRVLNSLNAKVAII